MQLVIKIPAAIDNISHISKINEYIKIRMTKFNEILGPHHYGSSLLNLVTNLSHNVVRGNLYLNCCVFSGCTLMYAINHLLNQSRTMEKNIKTKSPSPWDKIPISKTYVFEEDITPEFALQNADYLRVIPSEKKPVVIPPVQHIQISLQVILPDTKPEVADKEKRTLFDPKKIDFF